LITGEGGTGKTLLAKAIHDAGRRAGQPFIPVDPAALSEQHLEETLRGQIGKSTSEGELMREAHLNRTQATLFLHDIANLPIAVQGKLLGMLQNGELARLDDAAPQKTDVRVVAATNQDVESMILAGKFRKDLFCRFRGAWLHIPPLRERPEDIPALSDYFLTKWGAPGKTWRLEGPAAAALRTYEFPGNVRELQEVIRRAVERARGRVISMECLPEEVRRSSSATAGGRPNGSPALPLAEVEKQHILYVYRQMNHNKVRTARALGVGLNTLRRKLKGYGAP
jgi:DNA-binding NtrC family response regulator